MGCYKVNLLWTLKELLRKVPKSEFILTCVAVVDVVPYNDKPSPVLRSREPTFCKGSLTPARFQCKSATKRWYTWIRRPASFWIHIHTYRYIHGVSGGIVNILEGGSMDYSEKISSYKHVSSFQWVWRYICLKVARTDPIFVCRDGWKAKPTKKK